MAEDSDDQERNLDPTARRLERLAEQGRFLQSRDLVGALLIGFGFAVAAGLGGLFVAALVRLMSANLSRVGEGDLERVLVEWGTEFVLPAMLVVLGIIVLAAIIAIAGTFALNSFQPVFAEFKLNLERINPVSGLARVFSLKGLAELGKTILKVALLMVAIGLLLGTLAEEVVQLTKLPFDRALVDAGHLLLLTGATLFGCWVVLAGVDSLVAWLQFSQEAKMSLQEMKEEMKESEGQPEIKAAIRRRQQQMSRRRMVAAVSEADVVVVNPTHYAVAIRYVEGLHLAPVVVAKGTDEIAAKIREAATEFDVPIVRSPALARTLEAMCEVGGSVPQGLYRAVAAVLAWAYAIRRNPAKRPREPDADQLIDEPPELIK
jgi:flagellar biosynthetic protein FlhB